MLATLSAGTDELRDAISYIEHLPRLSATAGVWVVKVTDEKTLRRLARIYVAQGWPTRAENRALTAPYSAPSAGPPPWDLYMVTPVTAVGVATAEPYGATRWRFA